MQIFTSLNVCRSVTYVSRSNVLVLTICWIYVLLEILIQRDTQKLNWNFICRSVTYISCSSDFALYLEDYLIDKCHNWNIESKWGKDLPDKMCVGQWLMFHGPVILSYILKITWWINVVLQILIQCYTTLNCNYKRDLPDIMYVGQWPTFHGPVILSYILKTIWWINVVLEMLIQCDTNIELKLVM